MYWDLEFARNARNKKIGLISKKHFDRRSFLSEEFTGVANFWEWKGSAFFE